MVLQRQAVVLLVLLLGSWSATAYPTIWTAMTKDCAAVPQASYGPHSAPVQDEKTLMTIKRNGGAVAKICPGVAHKVKAVFPEQRQYIMTTSQGGFAEAQAECPNRALSQVAKPHMEAELTVPCDAKGDVTLSLLSVGAQSGDRTYQTVTTTMAVKDVKTCPGSPCNAQATNGADAAPGGLLLESAPAPEGMALPQYDAAQMAEIEKQIMALDPKLVNDGSVNVQDLLKKLGLQQQAMQSQPGVAAPAPDAAGAVPEAPKAFQIADILGPLKHMMPGQQAGGKDGQGVNPLKFLQSVANLMPQQGEGGAAAEGQNPLKMLQDVAALVAASSKGSKDGASPIMNLLQTVGSTIQGSHNSSAAQQDGMPILHMLQQLGSVVQGGKDKDGKPIKGLDSAAMLDVVKALGGLMPGENQGAPNMQSLMTFVDAVSKLIPGAGSSNEPAPQDLPAAGIAVLKSMAAMLPKEAGSGQGSGPNWPAMLQFVKSSGHLVQLLRPAAEAANDE